MSTPPARRAHRTRTPHPGALWIALLLACLVGSSVTARTGGAPLAAAQRSAVQAITGAGEALAAPASSENPILAALQRARLARLRHAVPPRSFVPPPLREQPAPTSSARRMGKRAVSAARPSAGGQRGQRNEQRRPAHPTTRTAGTLATSCTTIRKLLIYGPTSSPSGLAENTPCTTYTVWDEPTWAAKTTADFAAFDAIVFGDEPPCRFSPDIWATAVANNAVWSAAVTGNVVILGTDPDFHDKPDLVQNAVDFAATGSGTGLYVALSCAYWGNYAPSTPASVPLLSQFGNFVAQNVVNCPDNAHIVAHSPVLDNLTDAYLSNWSCSAHEGFNTWPSTFTPLTIIEDAATSFSFVAGDGTTGLVYMLASGNVGADMPPDQQRNATNCTCSTPAQAQSGEPFNTRTGNVWTQATDLDLPGAGPDLAWQRTYNSQATGDADQPGTLGSGWTDSFATRVITATMPGGEPGLAIVVSPSGNRLRFQDIGGGQYRSFPGVDATLAGNADGSFTETFPDQRVTSFNAQGQVTALGDGHGHQLTLTYSGANLTRVADTANPTTRYLQVDYAADGVHIADVKDPAGRSVQYSYDPTTGDLTQVTDVMGRHVSYVYNTHLLTEIDNTLGQAEERNSYDTYGPTGRVVAQTLQDGRQLAISYGQDATTITTTGPDGTQQVAQVSYYAPRDAMSAESLNGTTIQQVQFDPNFNAGAITDGNNNTTTVTSNSMGLPLSVTNALSQTSTVQYDAQSRPITATDTLGRQTALSYDSSNNLVRMTTGITSTSPLSLTASYVYNVRYPGKNWLEDQTDPDGVATHYDYNSQGRVTDVTVGYGTPQASATGYGYDSLGRVITTTVGLNTPLARQDVTRYNADNTISQTIENYTTGAYDPAHPDQDIVTRYGYDGLGRPAWRMDTLGRVSATHYNATGQVDWTLTNLQPVTLDGSGNPIIPATPPAYSPAQPDADLATLYGYDGLGRTALITQTGVLTGTFNPTTRQFSAAATRVSQVQYDGQSRPLTTTVDLRPGLPANSPDANLQTVTQYDNAGNLTWQRDPLGRWTETRYDALNRPYETIKNYENGDPTTVDPANRGWTDGSDSDLISYTTYNPDGTLASTDDNYVTGTFSASAPITDTITQYVYDPLGRLTQTVLNADPSQHTRTDTNRTTTDQYDPATGLQVGAQDALGRWTNTQYDGLSRPSTATADCTTGSGTPVATGCAAFDPAHPDRNVATSSRYDALGRAYETTDALGHVAHTDYDGAGRPVDIIQNYVASGPSSSTENVKTQTVYDGLGRTVTAIDARGNPTNYGYDGIDDRISATDPLSRTTSSGYDGLGELRWTLAPGGELTYYGLDGVGRVATTIRNYHTGSGAGEPADQDLATSTAYDAAGRTVQITDPAGVATQYTYDLLDRQTSATRNAVPSGGACANAPCNVTTLYSYDRAGNRTAVTDPNGHTRQSTYDAAGEQIGATDPLSRTTAFQYDLGGRLTGRTDPRGSADNVSYSYDGLDRLTQTAAGNLPAPIGASYDALGERTALTDGTGTTSFAYDPLGRISQVAAPNTGSVGYQYDANGQRTKVTYPDGSAVGYGYYPDGQLQAATQGASTLASYQYDGAGRLQQVSRANGAATTYTYDGADRPTDLRTAAGGRLLSDYAAQPDRLGQTNAVTETLAISGTSGGSGSSSAALPLPLNNAGTSNDGTANQGNFDTYGYSYSAQALAAAGIGPGAAVAANGYTFQWPDAAPGSPDNTVAQGQAIALASPVAGAELAFLGAASSGPSGAPGTITYTDGVTQTFQLTLSDWTLNGGQSASPVAADTIAATLPYRDTKTGGRDSAPTYLYTTAIPLRAGVAVAGVALPTAPLGQLHLFAATIARTAPPAATPTATPTAPPTATPIATATATPTAATASAPAYVQGNSTTPQSPQTTVTVAYARSEAAGDLNVVAVGWNDTSATVASVTDSAGNAYQVAVPQGQGTGLRQAIYYAKDIAGSASNTVTVTFSQAAAYPDVRIAEYAGLDRASPFDAGASGAGGGAGTADSGAAATTAAGDLLVGAGMTAGYFGGAGADYAARIVTAPDGDLLEDGAAGAAGAYHATAPVDSTWLLQLAAFKAAAGTATATPTPTPVGALALPLSNAGTSDDGVANQGNFDGGGFSYSAQALAAAGIGPGAAVAANGYSFQWPGASPGSPDNAVAQGQAITLTAPTAGASLAFLVAASGADSSGPLAVAYTDGVTETFHLDVSDWTLNGGKTGPVTSDTVAATLPYRDTLTGGRDTATTYLFTAAVPLRAGVAVAGITLPTTNGGTMHLFAATISQAAPPTATPSPTSTPAASATATATGTPAPAAYATRTITYSYDGLQRLTGAAESPSTTFGYTYDPAGNRTGVQVNGATAATYAYDAADQVQGWTYDAAGNLTSDGTTTYSYDALDELTGTSAISATRTYSYNGDGTLVSQVANGTTTRYAQDLTAGETQVLAATSGSATTDFLYGSGAERLAAVSAGLRTWYGTDAQGSVRQTLDDSANVLATQSYDPYGQPEAASRPSAYFGYTGELQDTATGDVNLRARWYQPGAGQLLGVDPALEQTGQPYAYAAGNPLLYADPSGLDCKAFGVTLPFGDSNDTNGCLRQAASAVTAALSTGATAVQNGASYTRDAFASAGTAATATLDNAGTAAADTTRRIAVPTLYWTSAQLAALRNSGLSIDLVSALTPGCVPGLQACELKSPEQMRALIYGWAVGTVGAGDVVLFGLPGTLLRMAGVYVPVCSQDYQTGQGIGGLVNGALALASLGGDATADASLAGEAAGAARTAAETAASTSDYVDTAWLGGELYPADKLAKLANFLARRGITLKVGDEYIEAGKAGGFHIFKDGRIELTLGSNPTNYVVWHELGHFIHFTRIGREAYLSLPRSLDFNAAEQFVFDLLENSPKRWDALTFEERQHAIEYIETIGGFR